MAVSQKSQKSYNMIVIGGGSAGLVTAYIAAYLKAKVALIEQHEMGGDCLNTGCVPSKALIKTAKLVQQIREHDKFGLKSAQCEVDFAMVMERVQKVIREIAPHDSVERYQGLGVECIKGRAEILDAHHVRVNNQELYTKSLVLALGAAPFVPPIPGLSQIDYLTSDNLWKLKELPRRLVVLGGGPIGCEMAQAFQRLGSAVTLVEKGPRILPKEDDDVAAMVQDKMAKEGVTFLLGCEAKEILAGNPTQLKLLKSTQAPANAASSTSELISFDKILVAVGRRARTDGVDWQRLGVERSPNGALKVDRYLRLDGKSLYACGDLIGPYQLTHAAAHQAWYCAVNGLFSPFKKFAVDYRVLPWVTFTDPEVARVGLSEAEAKAAGIPYTATRYGLDDLDRAIADSENFGQVKILTKKSDDTILGVSIVGHNAGEMLPEFTQAMKWNLGLKAILRTIHPYPTWTEANKYGAGVWGREHSSPRLRGLIEWLKPFHQWRRS